MNVFIRAFLFGLLFVCQMSYAVEVKGLYEIEVAVKSEQQLDREDAIRRGLKQVLLRILAGNDVLQNEAVKSVLIDAPHYVAEYQYSLAVSKQRQKTRIMRILFNDKLLLDVLHPGKLGFWNEIRPRTLVWLVVEDGANNSFFSEEQMPGIDAAMDRAAKLKALPVLYPMQDLDETRMLSINDVLSAYSDHLLDMSTRYDVVSTLAGKLTKHKDCWEAEWTLYFDRKIAQWSSACQTIDKVALNGFQGIYNRLSTYYAVEPDIQAVSSVIIKISRITDIPELTKVNDYLESLSMVRTVTWVGFEDGYNMYRVFYQGDRQFMNKAFIKDRVLRIENFSKENAEEVKYRLLSD